MKSFFQIDEKRAKKMEQLAIQQKLPQKAVELFPIGCAYYDVPQGATEPEEATLFMANEEFYNTLGYTREEFEKKGNRIFNVLMGGEESFKEKIREALFSPDKNFDEKIITMDSNGGYHHISCCFCFMKVGTEGILCVELFGVERLFYTAPAIYEELIQHADRLNRLWYLIKGQPGAVAVLDGNHRIVDMNDGMIEELGMTWEEFRENHSGVEIPIYEEDRRKFYRYMRQALKAEKRMKPMEVRLTANGKDIRWYEVGIMPYHNPNIGDNYAVMAVWNINHLKKVEEDLRVQMEQHNLLQDIYDEHIVEYNFVNRFCKVPTDFLMRRGEDYNNGIISEKHLATMMHADDLRYAIDLIFPDDSPLGNSGIFECRINMAPVDKEPDYEWYRTFYKKVYGADGKLIRILGRMVNIQRDKEKASAMEQRMRIDQMTMVLNKATIEKELELFFHSAPKGTHALLMIDVDNFKTVNDTFGHLYGDAVLKIIAETIRGQFRETDFVGRVGGDEFVVCMKDTKAELAVTVANDICALTKRVLHTQENEVEVSCSVGVAMYPEAGDSYEDLFRKAEHAMYVAKREGKNTVRYIENWGPAMEEQHLQYHSLREHGFDRAVQTDREFLRMSMELLADCKDLKAGMDLLLEKVAERYHLFAVSVFRYDKNRTSVERINYWSRESGSNLMSNRMSNEVILKRFLEKFDEDGRYCINDVSQIESMEFEEKEALRRHNVSSFVYAEYKQSVSAQGCLMFQADTPRIWSEGEKYFFSEFAKIYAVFIVLRDKILEDRNEITRLKNRDQLTGLMTAEAFSNAVWQRISKGNKNTSYFIVSSDITGFSYVNENFGTEAGNQVLRELAKILQFDSEDVIVCRQFSDFFVAFVANITMEKLEAMAKRIGNRFIRAAKKQYPVGGLRLSMGIYEWDNPEEVPLSTALENASIARKTSKSLGAGLVVYYDENMRKMKDEERRVLSSFNQSMAEGRILTYLQPQFDLQTKKVVSAEALARWEEGGRILPPAEFIEALERIGYIMKLDFYIFEQCLKTLKRWMQEGMELFPISVNFSKKHFDSEGIAKGVIEMTKAYGIPPEYIVIELTESAIEKHTDRILEEMNVLRQKGFSVSIDDFGSGYSSLNMLLHIPVDEVKLDKSFLDFQDESEEHVEKHKKFMKLLMELLGLSDRRIICEGVETKEQAEFLTRCGYSIGQGYLVAQPMSIKDFEDRYCKKN